MPVHVGDFVDKEPLAQFETERDGDRMRVRLSGAWKLDCGVPPAREFIERLTATPGIAAVAFDAGGLTGWDSGLLVFLGGAVAHCDAAGIAVDRGTLPEGVRRLLALATAVPERKGARKTGSREPLLARIGGGALAWGAAGADVLDFLGQLTVGAARLARGAARFRTADLLFFLQDCGARSLGIVSLISFLVGLILAFVGAIQLMMFGAQIYVADLVGVGMVRVMGAIMVGIVMTGRTGAAYAAQLGTMQVNEEVDALKTLGISPVEYLVVPRVLAITFMMPLLCLYADLMGILGGFVVGTGMLDIGFREYLNETQVAIGLTNVWIGLFHSIVFGLIIGISGCLRGLQCGRSASAVGFATTSAVVTGIVSIIVATAIITVMCNVLGI
jgi:phospholipid/cholesterol/gamma-HCH transport system permease protein